MDETNIVEFAGREVSLDPLTELLRTGAQALIQAAVQTELAELMDRFAHLKTPDGRAGVVRNGRKNGFRGFLCSWLIFQACNSQAPPTFECYCQFYGESNLPFCACFFLSCLNSVAPG